MYTSQRVTAWHFSCSITWANLLCLPACEWCVVCHYNTFHRRNWKMPTSLFKQHMTTLLLHYTQVNYIHVAGQNQVNITTSDLIVSYPVFFLLFIHSCAPLIQPISFHIYNLVVIKKTYKNDLFFKTVTWFKKINPAGNNQPTNREKYRETVAWANQEVTCNVFKIRQ